MVFALLLSLFSYSNQSCIFGTFNMVSNLSLSEQICIINQKRTVMELYKKHHKYKRHSNYRVMAMLKCTMQNVVLKNVQNGTPQRAPLTELTTFPTPQRAPLAELTTFPTPKRAVLAEKTTSHRPHRAPLAELTTPPIPQRASAAELTTPPTPQRASAAELTTPPTPQRASAVVHTTPETIRLLMDTKSQHYEDILALGSFFNIMKSHQGHHREWRSPPSLHNKTGSYQNQPNPPERVNQQIRYHCVFFVLLKSLCASQLSKLVQYDCHSW